MTTDTARTDQAALDPDAATNAATNAKADKARRVRKTIRATAIGAIAGFAGAFAFISLTDSGAIGDLDPSQLVAGMIALIYVLMAAPIGIGLLAPKAGAAFLNVEDADEMREERGQLFCSFLGMAGAGAALLVAALAGPGGMIDATTGLTLFAGLTVFTTVLSLWMTGRQDELMRAVSRETAAIAFYVVGTVGTLWALLAHLEFVAAPAPLDWLSIFWGGILLAAFIGVGRRGMLAMR